VKMVFDFERLNTFFLGRRLDPDTASPVPEPFLFKNKNFTTHAAIIGMTGSGKTGLGISIIEEAAMDSIPVIVIDPKGDMGNLMLAFPSLSPEQFLPWIDDEEAARKGMSREEMARHVAQTWRNGLSQWWQGPDRIKKYVQRAQRCIFTPGSNAGQPISLLASFDAPNQDILDDAVILNSLINSTVTGLLALTGIESEPLKNKEHLLLSNIFLYFWRRNQSLNLETIIGNIINPPFQKLGVLPLDTIYPSQERMKLAMAFNTILASPGFSSWLQGEPLDIGSILYTREGRPRISIFSIAHLSESERMFFVTILLNRFLNWLRIQPGTSSLRSLLYMDEISGYFPPVAEPPSKRPMLLLLKQARAYGAGLVLATQNPVDLDYRGLSNIGTWFIGRLQTRQDQDRVMDGLKTASSTDIDAPKLRSILSSLPGRTFLLRSVHLERPVIFQTRWVMSYLRGPLTLENIRRLSAQEVEKTEEAVASVDKGPTYDSVSVQTAVFSEVDKRKAQGSRPILSSRFSQYYLIPPVSVDSFILRPHLGLSATVRFVDNRRGIDEIQEYTARVFLNEDFKDPDWANAEPLGFDIHDLSSTPPSKCSYLPLPPAIMSVSSLSPFIRSWSDYLYRTCRIELYRVKALRLESRPGESLEDFRSRVAEVVSSKKAEALDRLEKKYEKRFRLLDDRLARAKSRLEKEQGDVTARGVDTAVSFGVAILGALFGRKTVSVTSASRAGRGIRSAGRMLREKQDVDRARENIHRIEEAISTLAQELDQETEKLSQKYAPEDYPVESFFIKPRRNDIFNKDAFIFWEAVPRFS